MKESRPGVFVRSKSPYVEIDACKSNKYVTFAKRASIKCRLNRQEGKELALFKLNGARILDEDVTIKGRLKHWTLGNYLLLMKKSPSSVKLGVGYFTSPSTEISSLSDSDSGDQGLTDNLFILLCLLFVNWYDNSHVHNIARNTLKVFSIEYYISNRHR